MTPRAALEHGVAELQLQLPEDAVGQLLRYLTLLEKWNRTFNLTAIRDPLKMVSHHLLDSLSVLPHLPMIEAGRLADAGSGAGLPGLALAIARPQWRVAVNDANEKKAAFLRQAAIELKLRNVEVHEGRVERWRPAELFRVVISRAFAELALFIESCRHLVTADGTLAAMKGMHPGAELTQVPAGCACDEIIALTVPLLYAERHLVLCRSAS
jgi:16S rRNA (guanine527-N7)-methyltransferase